MNFSVKTSFATQLPNSPGIKKQRICLNGTDNKTRIAVKTYFILFTLVFDRLMHYVFRREIKWKKITLTDQGKNVHLLINVNSLAKRTLLNRKEILSKSTKELSQIISDPSKIVLKRKPFNDLFPNIILINLDHRNDRIEQLEEHLALNGERDLKYTRLSATNGSLLDEAEFSKMSKSNKALREGRDDRRGRYACYMSHLRALKEAKAKGFKTVLILEDDVRMKPNRLADGYIQKAMKELPSDWDILFLGYYEADHGLKKDYSEHLLKPGTPYDCHGYLVNEKAYDRLIEAYEAELQKTNGEMAAVDVILGEQLVHTNQFFALKENVLFQDEGISSILNTKITGNYPNEVKEFNKTYHESRNEKVTADGMPIMPPLLAGTLYQMGYLMKQVFDKHGIVYWADAGTVLGMERHGALIPYDDDIDVCLAPGEEEKLKNPNLIADLDRVGLEVVDHWLGAKICAKQNHPLGHTIDKDGYTYKTPNIDLFFTKRYSLNGHDGYSYKTEKAFDIWPTCHYRHERVFNEKGEIKQAKFGPIVFNGLWGGKEFCKEYYGEDCFSEGYLQYDHINEKPLERRPIALTDYRPPAYKMWDGLKPIP